MAESDVSRTELEDRIRRLELLMAAMIAGGSNFDPSFYIQLFSDTTRVESDRDPLLQFLREYRPDYRLRSPTPEINEIIRASRDAIATLQLRAREAENWATTASDLFDHLNETLPERVGDLVNAEIAPALREITKGLEASRQSISQLSEEFHGWLSLSSFGLSDAEVKTTRLMPIRVYATTTKESDEENITAAIEKFTRTFGFTIADDIPEVRGSWLKRWFAKSEEVLSRPDFAARMSKVERALEMRGLEVPQAEVDQKKAAAAAELIKAVENTPSAAIQVGSILIIKTPTENGPSIHVRTLSTNELIQLESNQALLSSPASVLEKLSELCKESSAAKSHITIEHHRTSDGDQT